MQTNQAQYLIKSLFENNFNKNNFKVFLKNLLKTFEEKTFTYAGQYIPEAFSSTIALWKGLGNMP
jgi:hypothetical protein